MDQDESTADSVPTIRFTNVEDLIREKYSQPGDVLRVTNVSLMDFKKIDEEYEWNKIRISQYFESSRCMLVTIPTGDHERLHLELYLKIYFLLYTMGLGDSCGHTGAMTCYSQGFHSGSSSGSAGSADSSMHPFLERRRGFPTLMVEAGCSRSLSSMRSKAKWWFQMSNHDIKIVLLAKLNKSQRTIIVERWEEGQREHAGEEEDEWVASCQQTITISEVDASPPEYQVTGGDLVLGLRLLFLRSPQGEESVVVTVADLQGYARKLWRYSVSS